MSLVGGVDTAENGPSKVRQATNQVRRSIGHERFAGLRDPAKHPADSLRAFLRDAAAAAPPLDDAGEMGELVKAVKDGQRKNEAFAHAWDEYCEKLRC